MPNKVNGRERSTCKISKIFLKFLPVHIIILIVRKVRQLIEILKKVFYITKNPRKNFLNKNSDNEYQKNITKLV